MAARFLAPILASAILAVGMWWMWCVWWMPPHGKAADIDSTTNLFPIFRVTRAAPDVIHPKDRVVAVISAPLRPLPLKLQTEPAAPSPALARVTAFGPC